MSAHFVGEFLILPDIEPVFAAVGSAGFQQPMQFFDQALGQSFVRPVYNEVDTTEMVRRFDDVVNINSRICDSYRVGFKDEPGLLVGQAAAFDMIGVIGQVNLGTMIDSATDPAFFLFTKLLEKRGNLLLAFMGDWRIDRDVPGLSGQEGILHLSCIAPVTYGSFGKAVHLGILTDSDKFHIYRQFFFFMATNVTILADTGKKHLLEKQPGKPIFAFMARRLFIILYGCLLAAFPLQAQDTLNLVTVAAERRTSLQNLTTQEQLVTVSRIPAAQTQTLEQLLRLCPSIDIRERGGKSVQTPKRSGQSSML